MIGSSCHCRVRYWNLAGQIALSHFDVVWQFMLCSFYVLPCILSFFFFFLGHQPLRLRMIFLRQDKPVRLLVVPLLVVWLIVMANRFCCLFLVQLLVSGMSLYPYWGFEVAVTLHPFNWFKKNTCAQCLDCMTIFIVFNVVVSLLKAWGYGLPLPKPV